MERGKFRGRIGTQIFRGERDSISPINKNNWILQIKYLKFM